MENPEGPRRYLSIRLETNVKTGVNGPMLSPTRKILAGRLLLASLPVALLGASASAETARAERLSDPLRFFEGRTEGLSTIKVLARKPYRSRTLGRGQIMPDGALHLVQHVEDEGRAPYDRRWQIRQVAPGRFSGTMSEARGPVTVEEVGGRYRFRFRMKGSVSVEQWLTPLPGGRSASSTIIIRKLGMTVGHSEGTIRKL